MAFLRTVSRRYAGKRLTKCLMGLPAGTARPSVQMVQFCERSYSATPSTETKPAARQIDPLDLKFNDPVAAFKSKTMTELIRAYVVYQLCSIEYLVENNMKVS